jgi:hypothetical protein
VEAEKVNIGMPSGVPFLSKWVLFYPKKWGKLPLYNEETQMENTMKNIIATIALVLFASTAQAKSDVECTNTDLAIGVGVGVVGGAVLGVSALIGLPVMGAAAGTTMTWGMAMSAPFLTKATFHLATIGVIGAGPLVGTVGYYASCVTRNVMGE